MIYDNTLWSRALPGTMDAAGFISMLLLHERTFQDMLELPYRLSAKALMFRNAEDIITLAKCGSWITSLTTVVVDVRHNGTANLASMLDALTSWPCVIEVQVVLSTGRYTSYYELFEVLWAWKSDVTNPHLLPKIEVRDLNLESRSSENMVVEVDRWIIRGVRRKSEILPIGLGWDDRARGELLLLNEALAGIRCDRRWYRSRWYALLAVGDILAMETYSP